ncbi:GntR family transcriptional regulator [Rhodobacteraceae bacterium]|nr:GntR family transcriptional regulator [Paracoccaceae bacterium]
MNNTFECCMPSKSNNATGEEKRIISALEEGIVFGQFAPRERLVESDLMAQFHTRRHIIRSAISELERFGLVIRRPNRGASVCDLTREQISNLYDMRIVLQDAAAKCLALPVSTSVLADLHSQQSQYETAIAENDLRAAFRANDKFHDILNGLVTNPYLRDTLVMYTLRTKLARFTAFRRSTLFEDHWQQHGAIIDALGSGDCARLNRLLIAHLEASKNAYLAGLGTH